MTTFIESPRFPEKVSYGAVGGPKFKTEIIILDSGFESRNIGWENSRCEYDVAYVRDKEYMIEVVKFFRSVKGRAIGFRFKDWSDYLITHGDSTFLPYNGSANVLQLYKIYDSGIEEELRVINKPISGMVVFKNGSSSGLTIDATTGRITIASGGATVGTVSGMTNATNGVFTITGHSFLIGEYVDFTGFTGAQAVLNGNSATILSVGVNTITTNVDTTDMGTWSSGGSVRRYVALTDEFTAAGEFDVPCRFDTDKLSLELIAPEVRGWSSIPIVEVKVA